MLMIKKLLSMAAMALIAVSANAETTTLWTSSNADGELVNWSSKVEGADFSATDCANYNAGDKIIVSVVKFDTTIDKYPQIALKASGEGWSDIASGIVVSGLTMPNSVSFSLTGEQVATMKKEGFFISGCAAWITKVELETSDVVIDPNAIWFGEATYPDSNWWEKNAITISSSAFANAKVGDKVEFVCSQKSASFLLQPFFGGWSGIKLNSNDNPEAFTMTDNGAYITLTDEYLANAQKAA